MKFHYLILIIFALKFNTIDCRYCFDPNPIYSILSVFFRLDKFYTYTINGSLQEFQVTKLQNNPIRFNIDNYLQSTEINEWFIFRQLSFGLIDTVYLIAAEYARHVRIESIKIYKKHRGIGDWTNTIINAQHILLISSFNFSLKMDKIPYLIMEKNLDIKVKYIGRDKFLDQEDFICIYNPGTNLVITIKTDNCTEKFADYRIFNFITKFQYGFIYNDHIYLLSSNKDLVYSFNYVELGTKEFVDLIKHDLSDIIRCEVLPPSTSTITLPNVPTKSFSPITKHWSSKSTNQTGKSFFKSNSKILLIIILLLILILIIIRIYKWFLYKKQMQNIRKDNVHNKNKFSNLLSSTPTVTSTTKNTPVASLFSNKTPFKLTSELKTFRTKSLKWSNLKTIIPAPKFVQQFKSKEGKFFRPKTVLKTTISGLNSAKKIKQRSNSEKIVKLKFTKSIHTNQ